MQLVVSKNPQKEGPVFRLFFPRAHHLTEAVEAHRGPTDAGSPGAARPHLQAISISAAFPSPLPGSTQDGRGEE